MVDRGTLPKRVSGMVNQFGGEIIEKFVGGNVKEIGLRAW